MKVLATICARGGSKAVPGKNIRPLLGKPLIAYTIEVAQQCPDIERLVISTESDYIAELVEELGVPVPYRRPTEMASDNAPKINAILHATQYVEKYEGFYPDIVIDLDVGAPLRSTDDISACIGVLREKPELNAVVTIYAAERNPYFNMVEFDNDQIRLVKPGLNIVARQEAPTVYSVSGSIFAWRRNALNSVTHLFEGKWGGCIIPAERAIDIDHEIDFLFVEFLMNNKES